MRHAYVRELNGHMLIFPPVMMKGPELDSHFRVDHSLMWALTSVKHPQRIMHLMSTL